MPTEYHRIGGLRISPIGEVAEKAAHRIIAARFPRRYALTCDPEGVVQVEPIGHAVPDDIVGVYDPSTLDGRGNTKWIKLSRRIIEDIRHHLGVEDA